MKYALEEAGKEFLRVIIGGFVTVMAPHLIASINTNTGQFNINMGVLATISATLFITSLARAADKFMHEWNKEMHPEKVGASQGLVPF